MKHNDIVIAGAGLAGLAAAATAARSGTRVIVLDEASPGGRARTNEQDGFRFNRGPHAIIMGGPGRKVLARLGVRPAVHTPPLRGQRALADGALHPALSRRVLGLRAAAQLTTAFARISRTDLRYSPMPSTRDWLASLELTPKAAAVLETVARVSTYTADLGALPADVAVAQLRNLLRGVGYPDEGWQFLVDGLLKTATAAGAEFRPHTPVTAIDGEPGAWRVRTLSGEEIGARAVVIATGTPAGARRLLPADPGWNDFGPEVTAACLDLGVRHDRTRVAIGVDEPLYLSPHSPSGNLAPAGRGMVHVVRYGAATADADRARLEEFAALAGIASGDIATSRFLPSMTVVTAMPPLGQGLKGRPPVAVAGAPGLFVAGDWAGPVGWLADASLSSGERAGQLAAAAAGAASLDIAARVVSNLYSSQFLRKLLTTGPRGGEDGGSMGIYQTPITRRGALAVGAGAVIGGLGLSGTAKAAAARRVPPGAAIASMTPAQQAGQRVIFSYPGATPPQGLLDQIAAGEAGGVIFFGENITSTDQIAGVVAQLKEANAASPVASPLLIMTDQEGGIVRRLPGAPVDSEKTIGASSDPAAAAADAGTGAGQNLAGVGMDVNLAPVLDVYRQAGDFDDEYGRSYSSDPNVCAECGAAFVTTQQKLGIVATAKHFPGLGAATTAQNTDLGPVTLNVSAGDLRSIDEVPFAAAIEAGVQMVMASWALYPALDATYPSGLSATIIQRELRQRLGFRGVTITDAIEAGAISSFGTNAQCGVLAAKAGMDVLLASARDLSQGQSIVSAVAAALQDGTLDAGQSETALLRVLALRDSLS